MRALLIAVGKAVNEATNHLRNYLESLFCKDG